MLRSPEPTNERVEPTILNIIAIEVTRLARFTFILLLRIQRNVCRNLLATWAYSRVLQTYLSKGHISYYTTVRGPDILRNAFISGYITFCQIIKSFVYLFFFHCWQNVYAGRIWPAGRSLETLAYVNNSGKNLDLNKIRFSYWNYILQYSFLSVFECEKLKWKRLKVTVWGPLPRSRHASTTLNHDNVSIYCALLTPQWKQSLRSTSMQVGKLDP